MDRIQEAKRRRLMRKKLTGETLADNNEKISAADWVKKIANNNKNDNNNQKKKKSKKQKNKDNSEVKVKHDLNEIEAGKTIVLTLADSEILSKDGSLNDKNVATLENADLTNNNNNNKHKNLLQSLYGDEDDDAMNDDINTSNNYGQQQQSNILQKYDTEEKRKRKIDNKGFMLIGDAGKGLRLNEDVRNNNKNNNNNNIHDGKKRISLLSDTNGDNGIIEMQDIKVKKVKMKKRKNKKKRKKMKSKTALDDNEDDNNQNNTNKDINDDRLNDDLVDDDDDDTDLYASLARARKLAKKKKLKQNEKKNDDNNVKKSIEDIANYVAKSRNEKKKQEKEELLLSQQKLNDDDVIMNNTKQDNNNNDVDDDKNNININNNDDDNGIVSTTTEFTKKINQALLKSNTENGSDDDVKMSIDAEKDVFKKPDAKSSKNMTKKKALNNDVRSILRQEKVVQAKKNSLGAALSLLRDQGEFNNKNDILVGRKNDTKDGNVFSNINKPGDKIKLEYRDDKGRLLTPKEAFRQLSYRFHGIEPSKKTKEKRERQLNDRIDKQKSQLQKNKKLKDGGNFSSLVSGRFENKIKESQQPFVKLDI